jgi:hypothetical protein
MTTIRQIGSTRFGIALLGITAVLFRGGLPIFRGMRTPDEKLEGEINAKS